MLNLNRLQNALSLALIFGLAAPLLASSGRPDAYIQKIWKFKPGITLEQGRAAAEELNPHYKKIKTFEKRHLYYDKEKAVWIEQTKWKHGDALQEATQALSSNPAFKKFEDMLDASSVQIFKSERLFEVDN